ncbi:MAG: hypothetical protein LBK99_21680 [Opitutaceae bacterium]|jgi:hypothetical protein|nr:hypothetical protein [Opitutaceae bacterium]
MKITTQSIPKCLLFSGVFFALAAPGGAETIYATSNGQINKNSWEDSFRQVYLDNSPRLGSSNLNVDGTNRPVWAIVVFAFRLPDLGEISAPFSSATFSVGFSSYANASGLFNADLYSLGVSDTVSFSNAMYYLGENDTSPGVTKVADNFLDATVTYTAGQTVALTSGTLAACLNEAYAGGANAGKYVIFRLNPESVSSAPRGYNLYGITAEDENLRPLISYTLVPEPSAVAMVLGATSIACMAGVRFVGGCFRRD